MIASRRWNPALTAHRSPVRPGRGSPRTTSRRGRGKTPWTGWSSGRPSATCSATSPAAQFSTWAAATAASWPSWSATAPPGVELIQADLSHPETVPQLQGRTFDRVLFLQSFGYAQDPVHTLRAARAMVNQDGFILLTRTQPIRYAVERTERNGTTLGEEYFSQVDYTYRTGWNEDSALTKRTYTMSDLLNVFSAARLLIET